MPLSLLAQCHVLGSWNPPRHQPRPFPNSRRASPPPFRPAVLEDLSATALAVGEAVPFPHSQVPACPVRPDVPERDQLMPDRVIADVEEIYL